ncbi:MAG: immunoglobulin domain-containing protein [Piscinibacter sp.]|uniref:RCC1 domain-containing protein n=1 Tax=Piscinibacter sp. TaxID=1903157 RepID=UPI00258A92AD|nr:immunoglobulin domain-containing protein [Piscinibacter sp.]MCW5664484.1 immunoglobulin domain-containing protein [Piscinibacter sp.]
MKRFVGVLAALLGAALITGCGGGGDAAPPPMVGAAGGTVSGPAGAQVVVPAGALAQPTAVAVAQSASGAPALPGGLVTLGAVFAFTPHGTNFALPATMTVPFDPAALPAGRTPTLFKTDANGAWQALSGASVNAGSISAPVTSFSWAVVGLLPPSITQQPASASVSEPDTATFSVTALGTPPFTYQWQRSDNGGANWDDIAGATARSYTTGATSVAADDGDRYRVVITNPDGSTTSSAATLRVNAVAVAPAITTQPQDTSVAQGATATFSCTASGTAPAYQWQRSNDATNWTDIPGATNASYTTPATQAADDGSRYRCRASNTAGSVFSAGALLTVTVPGTIAPARLAAGGGFSIVALADGTLRAWGADGTGQLGTGAGDQSRSLPGAGPALSGVVALAAGSAHALALRGDGSVAGWGYNGFGQIGNGNNQTQASPAESTWIDAGTPRAFADAVGICAGTLHSLVLRAGGEVRAMGTNADGQLGDGSNTDRLRGVAVSGITSATAVACGGNHSLALLADGSVRAWGANDDGQLGDGTRTARNTPVAVSGLANVVAIAVGTRHSLALRSDGSVWAWGSNLNGKLGDGSDTARLVPTATLLTSGIVAIAAGSDNSAAVRNDGALFTVGINEVGELGIGALTPGFSATWQRAQASNVVAVGIARGGGLSHLLAQRSDGSVLTWGWNGDGELGRGPNPPFEENPGVVGGLNLN